MAVKTSCQGRFVWEGEGEGLSELLWVGLSERGYDRGNPAGGLDGGRVPGNWGKATQIPKPGTRTGFARQPSQNHPTLSCSSLPTISWGDSLSSFPPTHPAYPCPFPQLPSLCSARLGVLQNQSILFFQGRSTLRPLQHPRRWVGTGRSS